MKVGMSKRPMLKNEVELFGIIYMHLHQNCTVMSVLSNLRCYFRAQNLMLAHSLTVVLQIEIMIFHWIHMCIIGKGKLCYCRHGLLLKIYHFCQLILFNICHFGSNSTFKDHGRNQVEILIFGIQNVTVVLNPWIYQKTKYCSYPAPAGQRHIHKKSEILENSIICHIFAYFNTL